MTAMPSLIEERQDGPQGDRIEGLVSAHFDRAYLVLSTFVDDPRRCLALSERVFREVQTRGEYSERAVYGALVQQVRGLPAKDAFIEGIDHETVLCWLLKETSELSYADISLLTGWAREQVRDGIAQVRARLIA